MCRVCLHHRRLEAFCVAVSLTCLAASLSCGLDTCTQEPTFRPALRDVPWYIALGTLGIGISQSLVFVGNHLVGAAYAPIMVPTTPVYVALLSAAFGMEAFNRYKARALSCKISAPLEDRDLCHLSGTMIFCPFMPAVAYQRVQ